MELAQCHEMSIKAHEIMWQLIFCSDGWIYCCIVGINNPIKTALGSVLTRVVLLLVSQHALFWFEWLRSPAQLSHWCYICRGSQRWYRPSLWHLLNVKVFAEPQTIRLPARGPLHPLRRRPRFTWIKINRTWLPWLCEELFSAVVSAERL